MDELNSLRIMENVTGFIKYCFVGMISMMAFAGWQEMLVTGAIALFVGFMGAAGGFLARLATNYLKRRWPKIFAKPPNIG